MKNVLTIIKKELKGYFDHPTAYILLVAFSLLVSFFFFKTAFINNEASLRPLFDILPWVLLFFVPAVCMRSIAEEQKEGTLELVLTQPIRDWNLIVGKFVAALIFIAIAILLTLPIPASLNGVGDFDYGTLISQYLGAIFLAAALVAVGIFASSVTKNQIVAFIVGLAVNFVLLIAGFELIVLSLPTPIAGVFKQLSVLTHFSNISRGALDVRDIIYFLSLILAFLTVSYLLLAKKKLPKKSKNYSTLRIGTAIIVIIAIVVNLFGSYIGGRVDLTASKLYTLSDATKEIASNLNDIITVNVYVSQKLPTQVQLTYRDARDILSDYESISNGNIAVNYKHPDTDDNVLAEAQSAGIPPVRFNVLKEDEFQIQQGYFGLTIQYADKTEAIPFIEQTSDLEYQLTRFIKDLTTTSENTIGFLAGHGEKDMYQELGTFTQELSKQYTAQEVTIGEEDTSLPAIDVLVVAGPAEEIPEKERNMIKDFMNSGGKALFLIDQVSLDPQYMQLTEATNSFADFVEELGVRVNKDVVYDLRSNESVSFGGGFLSYVLPYPLWMRTVPSSSSTISSQLQSVVLPWASSVELLDDKLGEAKSETILSTTEYAGHQLGTFNTQPDQEFSQDNLKEYPMAVAISGLATNISTEDQSLGRFIVIGDSDFLTDQFAQNSPDNITLAQNSIDWLAQEEALIGIRSKNTSPRPLVFESQAQKNTIKYSDMIGIAVLIILYGAVRLWRRRKLTKRTLSV